MAHMNSPGADVLWVQAIESAAVVVAETLRARTKSYTLVLLLAIDYYRSTRGLYPDDERQTTKARNVHLSMMYRSQYLLRSGLDMRGASQQD